MATYVFDTMTQGDAALFNGAADQLFFLSATASNLIVTTNVATNLTAANYVLSSGGKSLTFAADDLADATTANTLTFTNGDRVLFADPEGGAFPAITSANGAHLSFYGNEGVDTIDLTNSLGNDTVFGSDGNDVITGSVVATGSTTTNIATQTDWLFGGAGDDQINGGAGNEHIYGFGLNGAGQDDGNDTINAGGGNDYVNGNAGNDVIDGEAGNDRLYGGAGDDTIDGGEGWDYLQGNKGNDVLDGEAGNDTVRGGQGDDTVTGGEGWDVLYGDAGNDVFVFRGDDASNDNIGNTKADFPDLTDVIMDFTQGQDQIDLGFTVDDILTGDGGTFASLQAAQQYATGLLAAADVGAGDIAAVQYGDDTYLFYGSAAGGATIDSAIKLIGITAGDLDAEDDFVAA
jgi:serralysin